VAVVLIDLGNAYVTESLHEDALYAEVIAAICEFFEREAADEQEGGSSKSDRSCPSKESVSKNRNSMSNIDAAISCYTEALGVLENNEETQKDIVAKALRKLGDCHFVQKSYPEALVFYEKALGLFRLAGTYGKESILENAHVLIMLGVATFMLHVYPRAAHVFELALHMVKHAYGLTLHTFLHGLILSLLGITFYKMKAYHKCVSFCGQAFETFWTVYEEKITELPQQKFWLVCQNLYMLGNTYNILNLQQKAIKFLNIGRLFMRVVFFLTNVVTSFFPSLSFIKQKNVSTFELQWNPLSPKTHYKKIRVTNDVFDGPANSLLCYACCSRTLHEMPSPDA
jgi:tetratricopeptide (TPR) repeat protein